jgi:hypothetical protein
VAKDSPVFGIFLFLFVFLRIWGMPRAGIYFLAMLQASKQLRHSHSKTIKSGFAGFFDPSDVRSIPLPRRLDDAILFGSLYSRRRFYSGC